MNPIFSAPAFAPAAASGGDIAPPPRRFSAAFGAVALAALRSALGREGSFMVLGIGGAGEVGRLSHPLLGGGVWGASGGAGGGGWGLSDPYNLQA